MPKLPAEGLAFGFMIGFEIHDNCCGRPSVVYVSIILEDREAKIAEFPFTGELTPERKDKMSKLLMSFLAELTPGYQLGETGHDVH